jgi:hypothetical protein
MVSPFSIAMLAHLYARFSNGRVLSCFVEPEKCIDEAITLVCSGAVYVSIAPAVGSQGLSWSFHRNVRANAATPRPIRKAVLR